jgi:hypothetical protein
MTKRFAMRTADNVFGLLTVISERDESFAAFDMLKKSVESNSRVFSEHFIGYQFGEEAHRIGHDEVEHLAVFERETTRSALGSPRPASSRCLRPLHSI